MIKQKKFKKLFVSLNNNNKYIFFYKISKILKWRKPRNVIYLFF